MKNKIIIGLIFILPVLGYFILNDILGRQGLVEEAMAKADCPQVYVFSTKLCSDCKKMAPIVEDAKVKYQDNVNIVKLDAMSESDDVLKLIEKFDVQVVPTMIFTDKNGEIINKVEGAIEKNEFEQRVEGLIINAQ